MCQNAPGPCRGKRGVPAGCGGHRYSPAQRLVPRHRHFPRGSLGREALKGPLVPGVSWQCWRLPGQSPPVPPRQGCPCVPVLSGFPSFSHLLPWLLLLGGRGLAGRQRLRSASGCEAAGEGRRHRAAPLRRGPAPAAARVRDGR